jgi:hypothetical protein
MEPDPTPPVPKDPKAAEAQRKAQEARRKADAAAEEAKRAEAEVKRLEKECKHDWKVEYDPIVREAYTIPGDEPGTMGVDWRGPTHVPSETTRQWTRTCNICGAEESTQRTKKQHVAGPVEGTGGEVEVPDFGDERRW